jgi:AsmA protein
MRLLKTILYIFIGLILLIGAVLTFFILTFDGQQFKQEIEKVVADKTGRDLQIDGDLSLSVFPSVAIKMGKSSINNAEGFQPQQFAKFDAAEVSVELMPLLQKELKVESVLLDGLNLHLHRKADGSTNWDDFVTSSRSESKAEVAVELTQEQREQAAEQVSQQNNQQEKMAGSTQEPLDLLKRLSIAGINLNNANIHWQDDVAKESIQLSPVYLKTGTFEYGKALPIDLQARIKKPDMQVDLSAKTDATFNQEAFAMQNLDFKSIITGKAVQDGTLKADLQGNVTGQLWESGLQTLEIPDLKLQAGIENGLMPNGQLQLNSQGNLKLNLAKNSLYIKGLSSEVNAQGDAVQGGALKATIRGDTLFNLVSQILSMDNAKVDANYSGGALKNGQLNTQLSAKTRLDLAAGNAYLEGLNINTKMNSPDIPGGQLTQQATGQMKLNWKENTGSADFHPLNMSLAGLNVSGSTTVKQLLSKPTLSGHFKTNDFNLSQLLTSLGIQPPKTGKPGLLGAAQANFKLDASAESIQLSTLRMKLDDLAISGDAGVANLSGKPKINANLSLPKLNVDDYVAPSENEAANPGAALLPLAAMRDLNGDIQLAVGSMVYSKIRLQNVKLGINANNGVVKADPIAANLYQGQYKGQMTLNSAKQAPTLAMQHQLSGLRSEDLLFDLYQDKLITGAGYLTAKLNTAGNSVNAIKQNLNGTIDVEFRDGTIRDSNFAKKTEIAIKAFEEKKTDGEGKESVKFTKLAGNWQARNGVFSTDSMQMLAPRFMVKGSGDVDLPKELLDFKLRLSENKENADIFVPLRIFGPFAKLSYELELDVLLKSLAQKRLAEEKQKALEKLEAEKKKAQERLKREAEERLQQEQEKLQKRIDEQKKKLEEQLKEKVGKEVGDKLEEQLKDKLKSFF